MHVFPIMIEVNLRWLLLLIHIVVRNGRQFLLTGQLRTSPRVRYVRESAAASQFI